MNSIAITSLQFGDWHNPVVVKLAVTAEMKRLMQSRAGPLLIEDINER
jgi:hypothetical protein